MPQTTILSLAGPLPAERLGQLTRALAEELARADLDAHPADTSVSPGVEVGVASPGQIALGAITSAGVTALIGCLQEVLERESGLVMHLRQPSGNEIEFNADNLDEAKRALAMSVSPPA